MGTVETYNMSNMTRRRDKVSERTQMTRERGVLHIAIHPEVRAALKIRAITERRTMPETLHSILCHELGREDLMMQAPDPVGVQHA